MVYFCYDISMKINFISSLNSSFSSRFLAKRPTVFFKIPIDFLPKVLNHSLFRQVDDYSSTDEWLSTLESAHSGIKSLYLESNYRPQCNIGKINLDRSYNEFLAKIYEENLIFLDLASKDHQFKQAKLIKTFKVHPFFEKKFHLSFFTLIDTFFYFLDAQKQLIIKLIFILQTLFKKPITIQKKGCIRGLSESEIPKNEASTNCFWFDQTQISSDFFYYANESLKTKAKGLSKNPIYSHHDLLQALSKSQVLIMFYFAFKQFIFNIFNFNLKNYFLSFATYDATLWYFFNQKAKLQFILSTISESFPTPVEIEVLNDQKTESFLWSYSFYGLRMSESKPIKDRYLLLSLSSYKNYFFWNDISKNTILEQRIDLPFKPLEKKFFSAGINLNSNFNSHTLELADALKKLNIPFNPDEIYISIFDLIAWKSDYRRAAALGPYMTEESQELFYLEIFKLLNVSKKIKLLIKSKRNFSNNFYFPKSLEDKIKEKNESIYFLPEHTDPNLIVMASDLIITSTFTSPTIIGLEKGIQSLYFDPSKRFNYVNDEKVQKIVYHEIDDLKKIISELKRIPRINSQGNNFIIETLINLK